MTDPDSYRRLAALAHAGHALAGVETLEEAVECVARCGLDLVGGSSASIGRVEPARGLIRVLRNHGDLATWEEATPRDEVYPLGDFPWLDVAPERAMAWYGHVDDPTLPPPERRILESLDKRAMLTVPLVVDRAVWGMLAVVRGHACPDFTAEDLAAGEALGGMVGAALARMEERSELRALAYRDALTGLANRRAVDDRLEELFAVEPLPSAVGLVLCDVDGLKAVNDGYGHEAGDTVLREVGRILSVEAGRLPGCLAARLGGDEFCLVVDDAEEQRLEDLSARLTARAAALGLGSGLSCGYAVAHERPGDAETSMSAAKALLRLADAAQYRVKRSGAGVRSRSAAWPLATDETRTVTAAAVDEALNGLAGAGEQIEQRLEAVAVALADVTNAGAWAVSRSEDGGPAVIVRNVDQLRVDGREAPGYEPGVGFALEDYPATREALWGGIFHATLASGDTAERGFLAASGYTEIIGAGRRVGPDGWLVEVCGDALSETMLGLAPLLRLLVELAVVGSQDGASEGVASVRPPDAARVSP